MAEKASAYKDYRRRELTEHRLYQDIPGTAVYEFLEKKGSEYQFRKRDISNPKKPRIIRIKTTDLSFLVPISKEDIRKIGKRTRVTLRPGSPYVHSP